MTSTLITVKSSAFFRPTSTVPFTVIPTLSCDGSIALFRTRKFLDAVEGILGPNLTVRDTAWFVKMPGDKKYISWHQDGTYWGLHPPKATTAWIVRSLGKHFQKMWCMRVMPGSHKHLQPHQETYAADNAAFPRPERRSQLMWGRKAGGGYRPTAGPDVLARCRHSDTAQRANTSDKPRIGLAARYMPPEVVQAGKIRQLALLVRGQDSMAMLDLLDAPQHDDPGRN